MLKRLVLLGALFIINNNIHAQLHISYNGNEINYTDAEIKYAFTPKNDFSQKALADLQAGGWKPLINNKLPISDIPNCVWLKIPVRKLLHSGPFQFVNINNPHINFLQCWVIQKDSIVQQFKRSGDNLPFDSRPLPTPSFVYPIDGNEYKDCDIVIAADKRYTKLDLLVELHTEQSFLKQSFTRQLTVGLFIGIGLFILVFNLLLYLSIRQDLYLWYFLYALTIIFYLNTEMGLMFKYFYPNFPGINDVIRPAVFSLSVVPLLQFFNALLDIKNKLPKLYLFNKRLAIGFLILVAVAVTTSSTGNYEIQGMWVYVNRIVSPLMMGIILCEAFYCYYKKIRYAIFAMLSWLGFSILIIIYVLQQGMVIVHNSFTSNCNYWAMFFESMVMAFALAWRFKFYKEDSERLLKENQLQQENIFSEIAVYQEKEMQRMSSLLHDSIGADLGLLRLEMDNMKLTETARQQIANHITRIGNEVRTMSHSFSPTLLTEKGLHAAIAENIQFITANSSIKLQFEWIGKIDKTSFQNEVIIYRIVQEILQNLLKHSKAKNAILQIFAQENQISIYAEDDGIGISSLSQTKGIGLKSIEKLVSLLKGHFKIDSTENTGFSISIEFNLMNNEKI